MDQNEKKYHSEKWIEQRKEIKLFLCLHFAAISLISMSLNLYMAYPKMGFSSQVVQYLLWILGFAFLYPIVIFVIFLLLKKSWLKRLQDLDRNNK